MRRTTLLIAAMALAFATGAHAQDCAPALLASIKTSALADGRITLPVTVEGHALSFLLDTGGVNSTIKWDLARQMQLPVKQSERKLTGVGGSVLNFALANESLTLGALRVQDKPV